MGAAGQKGWPGCDRAHVSSPVLLRLVVVRDQFADLPGILHPWSVADPSVTLLCVTGMRVSPRAPCHMGLLMPGWTVPCSVGLVL